MAQTSNVAKTGATLSLRISLFPVYNTHGCFRVPFSLATSPLGASLVLFPLSNDVDMNESRTILPELFAHVLLSIQLDSDSNARYKGCIEKY